MLLPMLEKRDRIVCEKGRGSRAVNFALFLALAAGVWTAQAGQAHAARAQVPQVPVDTSGLAHGPFAMMEMLYERTFLNVDVLQLTIRFDEATRQALEALGQDAPADSLAAVALRSRSALTRSVFLRDVGLDRFLDGLHQSLDRAHEAGILSDAQLQLVLQSVDSEYEALRERGIRRGDAMWYRIRGDSLHVVVQAADGEVLLESRPVGPERRRAVLGGYLAPRSEFREKLLESLGLRSR